MADDVAWAAPSRPESRAEPRAQPRARPRAQPPPRRAVVGYTAGVFDLFHIGHLNLLRNARAACDMLIVGVTTDEMAQSVKGVLPVVSFLERIAIVASVRYVDCALPQTTMDKLETWQILKFDVLFAGDNVKGRDEWRATEQTMHGVGVEVRYLPATYAPSGEPLTRRLPDLTVD